MDTSYNLRGHLIDKNMKAIALSRSEALHYQPLPDSVMISYAGYDHGKMAIHMPDPIQKHYQAVLELAVDDIDQRGGKVQAFFDRLSPQHDYHIFDSKDCKKVFAFMEKYQEKHFVVHCDAGVSRSAATALAIAKRYAPEDYQKLLELGVYFPNVLIYSYLVDGTFNDELAKKYRKELHPWGF